MLVRKSVVVKHWLCIFLFWGLAGHAVAALHKCVDENGKTRYSDVPCPEELQAEVKFWGFDGP